MIFKVTFTSRSCDIHSKDIEGTQDFTIGDKVLFIPNGLEYRVTNKRTLKWMQESGLYVKPIL